MLEKFRYLPHSELVAAPPAEPQSIRCGHRARHRGEESRRHVPAHAVKHADVWINIDHHITNERYGDLALHRLHRAGHRTDSLRAVPPERSAADLRDGGQSLRRDQHRHRLLPVSEHHRAHLRDRRRARSAPASTSASFRRRCTRAIRAAGSSCCARCSTSCASPATIASPASRSPPTTAQTLGALPEDNEGLIDHIRADRRRRRRRILRGTAATAACASACARRSPKVDVSKVCGAVRRRRPHARRRRTRRAARSREVQEQRVLQAIDPIDISLMTDALDGVLLVDKAPGMTSHDVVAIVRRRLGTKKVGHCGTLDPLATGLLTHRRSAAARRSRICSWPRTRNTSAP